jgi:uncharacterized protein
MAALFCIRTDRATVHWSGPQSASDVRGTLRIHLVRPGLVLQEGTHRAGVPSEIARDPTVAVGPALFEETSYDLLVQSESANRVSILHRDPGILSGLVHAGGDSLLHGSLNFRSQIGESRFTLLVNGEPELDFTVEVFPSKITYREDFVQMIGRVQDLATGLALEYLRATYHLGAAAGGGASSRLEWLALLRHLVGELEQALHQVSAHPHRGLVREERLVRAEQLRRADHALRQAVLRDRGQGPRRRLRSGIPVRAHLPEQRPNTSLDTLEHRWLAAQLTRARRRLAAITQEEAARQGASRFPLPASDRRAILELQELDGRLIALERLGPLAAATAPPPTGFTSLQLQSAPGYREAFQALTILQHGLRIGGGPVELALKDLHLLYEYWCFLEVVHLIARLIDHPIPAAALVEIRAEGLRLRLEQGRAQTVPFLLAGDRSLEVTYNPTFQDQDVLLPQRPDVSLTFRDPKWPTVRLVLDAKYRVRSDADFVTRFGSPGPPEDAVNVLHRYRDAILEGEDVQWRAAEETEISAIGRHQAAGRRSVRTVVEGAALFPLDGAAAELFETSRFWESLQRLGIGALPFLPNSTRHVEMWLAAVLRRSGWDVADRTVGYAIQSRASRWSRAADEGVLIGVLRGDQPLEHLRWIEATRTYYTRLTPTQARQLTARWVALYSPARTRSERPGAVTHFARVESIRVRRRAEIETPWPVARDPDELQVVYGISELKLLAVPVENRGRTGAHGARFAQNRWTSRLALDRASEVTELLLESRAEWIFYERLRAEGRPFRIIADGTPGPEIGLAARVWFEIGDLRVRWAGLQGWDIWQGGQRRFVSEPP